MKDQIINAKVKFPTLGYSVLTTGQDIYRDKNVEVCVHVGINASGHAWYDFYDTAFGGEKYQAGGTLDIEKGKLVDYDGVGSLPTVIMDILFKELNVDVTEIYYDDGQPNDYMVFKYRIDDRAFDDWDKCREYIHSLNLDRDANRAKFHKIEQS